MTKHVTLTAAQRHRLAVAPLPTSRRIPGKTWAGALISRDDSEIERLTGFRYVEPDKEVAYFPDSHQSV